MTHKIFHAADLHLGMAFRGKSTSVKDVLKEDRFNALQNIVNDANSNEASFLVLAGDTFDTVNVSQEVIARAVKILGGFLGEAVLVLPGNHDWYEFAENTLWQKFKRAAAKLPKIQVLHLEEVYTFELNDTKFNFYPGCCLSQHSAEHAIGWIQNEEKDLSAFNIGIAHGNVAGMALDTEGDYFTMGEQDFNNAGLDLFLLGHVHVPFPVVSPVLTKPTYFMPGTSSKFSMGKKGNGTYWVIESDGKTFKSADLRVSSEIEHLDWSYETVNSAFEVDQLITKIQALPAEMRLLRLHISGRLTSAEIQSCRESLINFEGNFIEFKWSDSLQLQIDQTFINTAYVPNSLEYKLLNSLAEEDPTGLALNLAYDLVSNPQ
jgi:exonuclease SbcD